MGKGEEKEVCLGIFGRLCFFPKAVCLYEYVYALAARLVIYQVFITRWDI